ncbi:MAG: hypothetical protein C5B51_11845 [Terriglobia bacterium]|nr:MAG: hypothetical protein C5B51_11845 [Terriglobia bacterium]
MTCAFGQALIIPQVADGGGWQTTLVLTNTTTSSTAASVSFYQDTSNGATIPWNISFLEVASTQSITVPAAASIFLHSTGTAAATSVGWASINVGPGVAAYAIFKQRVLGRQDQEGTATAAAAATRILVPFDNTGGGVTAIAVVNPGASSQTISATFRTVEGAVIQGTLDTMPAQGHMAFGMPQQFPRLIGRSGLAEFYSTTGTFSMLALRFNSTNAFTAAPVYPQAGAPIIPLQ